MQFDSYKAMSSRAQTSFLSVLQKRPTRTDKAISQVTCSGFAEDWASALGQMGPRWKPPGPGDETIIFGTGHVKGESCIV